MVKLEDLVKKVDEYKSQGFGLVSGSGTPNSVTFSFEIQNPDYKNIPGVIAKEIYKECTSGNSWVAWFFGLERNKIEEVKSENGQYVIKAKIPYATWHDGLVRPVDNNRTLEIKIDEDGNGSVTISGKYDVSNAAYEAFAALLPYLAPLKKQSQQSQTSQQPTSQSTSISQKTQQSPPPSVPQTQQPSQSQQYQSQPQQQSLGSKISAPIKNFVKNLYNMLLGKPQSQANQPQQPYSTPNAQQSTYIGPSPQAPPTNVGGQPQYQQPAYQSPQPYSTQPSPPAPAQNAKQSTYIGLSPQAPQINQQSSPSTPSASGNQQLTQIGTSSPAGNRGQLPQSPPAPPKVGGPSPPAPNAPPSAPDQEEEQEEEEKVSKIAGEE